MFIKTNSDLNQHRIKLINGLYVCYIDIETEFCGFSFTYMLFDDEISQNITQDLKPYIQLLRYQ